MISMGRGRSREGGSPPPPLEQKLVTNIANVCLWGFMYKLENVFISMQKQNKKVK